MKASPLHLPRFIIFGLCTIFSVIVLGLSAHLTNVSSEAHAVTDNEVMGLVTSILSILIFPALIIVPRFVFILTELVVICIMWILWVVTAALTIQARNTLFGGFDCSIFVCESLTGPPLPVHAARSANTLSVKANTSDLCHQVTAVEGLSVTIFVLLMLYMVGLLAFATVAYFRHSNRRIWYQRMDEKGSNIYPSANQMT
ncbi:hypothetical protein HYPSUDRAFT_43547 [Hypholoma sublateritium FD-334 SS-4]|uniref:MARVEL domain-containing protein n=1 Tax=Hypholoma sublateritium (strain FD-334 SS-4) TaxID=945553 RepID=A0A0D2L0G4_HYPSF|nr:hypothetical protein HYPSUDRAFT_43547 [Hypholoma sublateritium FD-334 SS-4]